MTVSRPAVLGLTIACAALGAALGTVLARWSWTIPLDRHLLWAAGTGLLGADVAWLVTAWPAKRNPGQATGRRVEPPPATRAPATRRPETHPPGTRAPETRAPETRAPETRAPETRAPETWWERAPEQPPRRVAAAPALPRAAEPSPVHRDASTLIAQCPSCGDFRLDIQRDQHSYSFRCAGGCGHIWDWAPGSPWPAVVVRRIASDRLGNNRLANNRHSVQIEHRNAGI